MHVQKETEIVSMCGWLLSFHLDFEHVYEFISK